jgi:hypothetical protein
MFSPPNTGTDRAVMSGGQVFGVLQSGAGKGDTGQRPLRPGTSHLGYLGGIDRNLNVDEKESPDEDTAGYMHQGVVVPRAAPDTDVATAQLDLSAYDVKQAVQREWSWDRDHGRDRVQGQKHARSGGSTKTPGTGSRPSGPSAVDEVKYDDPVAIGSLFELLPENPPGGVMQLPDHPNRFMRRLAAAPETSVQGPNVTGIDLTEWTNIPDNTTTTSKEHQQRLRLQDDAQWQADQLSCNLDECTSMDPGAPARAAALWAALCVWVPPPLSGDNGTACPVGLVVSSPLVTAADTDAGYETPPPNGSQDPIPREQDDPCGTFRNALRASLAVTTEAVNQAYDREFANRRLRDRIEVESLDPRQTGTVEGMKWFDLTFKLADMFSNERSPDQVQFHDAIFQTCAPHILGDDYLFMRQELMERFGRTEPNMAALIMTPRRWGKTTAVAMALACIMYVCRGVNIIVFSTGQDMSTTLMGKVRGYFMELPGAASRVSLDNVKEFSVTHAGTAPTTSCKKEYAAGRKNTLLARAATVQGNKGITADIFVLEEASRIDMDVLHEVIAPMMKVSNSVLLALSTHLGEDNYYTKLFDSNHPATARLFLRIRVELMCARCKRGGVDPSKCSHLEHLHPAWLLGSNAERVKLLMEGNSKMYAQEVLGVVWSDQTCIFKQAWITAFENRPCVPLPYRHGCFVTTMIDPAGSGSSNTAMCSIVRRPDTGEIVIVGMAEANPQTTTDTVEMIRQYMTSMRENPALRNLDHVMCVESNYGGPLIASMFWEISRAENARLFEYRSFQDISGVVTNNQNKCAAALSSIWDMCKNRIHFHESLVTLCPGEEGIQDVKKEFFAQCGRLHKKFLSSGKWTYSAKTSSGKGQDDIMIAFLFASYYSRTIAQKSLARKAVGMTTADAI